MYLTLWVVSSSLEVDVTWAFSHSLNKQLSITLCYVMGIVVGYGDIKLKCGRIKYEADIYSTML